MGQMPLWAQQRGGALLVRVHAQPGARRSAFAGVHGERLKIALQAPPVDGRANDLLLRFLADALELPRSALQIVSGASSREKSVAICAAEQDIASLVERVCRLAGIRADGTNETAAHKARPGR
jgi:uncharacterized protein